MKLLVLNYEYPPLGGGAGNALAHLAREWVHMRRYSMDIVVSSPHEFQVQVLAPGLRLHRLDIGKPDQLHYQTQKDLLRYAWKSYGYCRMLLAERRYDGCLAFFGIPCGVVARGLGLPYIVSLRGSDVPFYNPRFAVLDRLIFQRLSRRVWGKASAVVANSDGLRQLARQTAPDVDIGVIPNGVDVTQFLPAAGKPLRLEVLSVARLIPRKGLHHLVEAIAQVPEARLTIVGGGTERENLEALAGRLGVGERVRFLGGVDHDALPEVYRQASVFVLPSMNEGMSNTVLEAMASGLPVLLTETGGTRELLEEGENGYVVEQDAKSIADALRRYLSEPGLVASHGAESRRRAESMSWKAAAEAYAGLFERHFRRGVA